MRENFFQLCLHVDYIKNVKLEECFLAQKKKFENAGKEMEEVLLWHGTNPSSLEPILRNNFDIESAPLQPELGGGREKKMLFGRGIYFSEVPTVSLMYGNTLILCRVVLGACQNFTPVAGHRVLTFSCFFILPTYFYQSQSNRLAAVTKKETISILIK